MTERLFLSPPHMGGEELTLLQDAYQSNWIAPLGPHVDAFEQEFGAAVGVKHAAALSSGTAALHLALQILGVGKGDAVLCSTLTFVASASPITWVGAEPVFVDCSRETWNIDPALVAEEIESAARRGKAPKAVVAVDLYGQVADLQPIAETCRAHGVELVEDAAEALGATYRGKSAGASGRISVFSFNGNKIITTSGGGMMVSAEPALVQRARFLSQQARDPGPHYQHSVLGNNYRMSNLLAAVGRGQLRVLPRRVERKRAIFEVYRSALAGVPGIEFMPEASYGRSTRWLTAILIDPREFGATRQDVWLHLESQNIEARPVWKPMHLQPVFAGRRVVGGAVAADLFERGLCLPSGTRMTDADVSRVVDGILEVRKRALASRGVVAVPSVSPAAADAVAPASAPPPAPVSPAAIEATGPVPLVAGRRQRLPAREPAPWSIRRLFPRRIAIMTIDLVTMAAAFGLAYLLRFDFDVPVNWRWVAVGQLPLVLMVQLTALYASGGLSFIWKHVGMDEVPAFVRAALGSAAVLLAFRYLMPAPELYSLKVPVRVILIDTVLAFGALLALRVGRRAVWERSQARRRAKAGVGRRRRVLLLGAGAAGITAVREIRSRGEHEIDLRGFVDDDRLKAGALISGVRVLGRTDDLPRLVPALGIEQVIVTITDATEEQLARIVGVCESIPVKVQRLPTLYGVLEGVEA